MTLEKPKTVADAWQADDCRARGDFHEDQVEQLVFELSWELEEACLNPQDLVTVNRAKLRTIATRVLARLDATAPNDASAWVNSIPGVKPEDQFIAVDRRALEKMVARVLDRSAASLSRQNEEKANGETAA